MIAEEETATGRNKGLHQTTMLGALYAVTSRLTR